jgi:beta-xylosidase
MKKYLILVGLFLYILGAYSNFNPGETWNDTSGTKINCHGGQVVYYNGSYYWFGENRASGVSLYKSSDLYNWQKLTDAYTPSGSQDPNGNDGAKGRNLERPKVLYNDKTSEWVMHVHWENGENYNEARVFRAHSSKIEGPYTFYKTSRPNDHDSRDQNTFKDNDGTGYHIGSTGTNTDTLITKLTDNYLDFTTTEYRSMAGKKFEAACIWRVGDTYLGIYSLCTGWDPNKGRLEYFYCILFLL